MGAMRGFLRGTYGLFMTFRKHNRTRQLVLFCPRGLPESDDAVMTRIEGRMTAAARVARDQLTMIAGGFSATR
jgi:hypothetical protein